MGASGKVRVPMVSGEIAGAGGNAVRQVNEALQGSVLAVLCQFLPELKKLPADRAYERTLDDIGLLDRCFQVFRARRDKFQSILVDAAQRPVSDDSTQLACGRSLEQVVAMIVRTAAKRHFRRRHAPHAAKASAAHQRLHQRLTKLFTAPPPPTSLHATALRGRAEELYDALKAHLLHEWQVPLVPTYAEMSPNLARSLGEKLLELKDIAQLRKVVDDPEEAAKLFETPEQQRAARDPGPRRDERARLSDILAPGGGLKIEAFAKVLQKPDLRAQLRPRPTDQPLSQPLRETGTMAAKLLVAELGLRLDQVATVLLVAHETIGAESFTRFFGPNADAAIVIRLTQRARQAGLTQASGLGECAEFVRQLFKRADPA